MVKDKSHKMHQDFFHTVSQLSPEQLANVPDHYQFTPEQLPYWDHFDTVKLRGGAGSLFLWDSRTTHSVSMPLWDSHTTHSVSLPFWDSHTTHSVKMPL